MCSVVSIEEKGVQACKKKYCYLLAGLLLGAWLLLTITTQGATVPLATYDLSRDYSTTSNPGGVWSYGWKSNFTDAFHAFMYYKREADLLSPAAYIDTWSRFVNDASEVTHNGSDSTAYAAGGGTFPPGTTIMLPGQVGRADNYSVIRFTAPATGNYLINLAVQSWLQGSLSGDSDFYILKNSVQVFGQIIPKELAPPSTIFGYTNVLSLAAGDTIEFLNGRGPDNVFNGSGVKLFATISLSSTEGISPMMISQPQSQTVVAGSSISFNVTAIGSPTLAYQWRYNGSAIPGATNSSLSFTHVQPAQAGNYSVIVSNGVGSVTSASAVLTVTTPLSRWDLSDDFSTNANPAGAWSYGWKSNYTGNFTLYTYFKTSHDPISPPGAVVDVWARYSSDASQIEHNGTTLTALAQNGEGVFPPGTVILIPGHVGREDNYAVARFTAPLTGNYLISSAVQNMLHGPSSTDADFHVLRDGVELYGAWLPADTGTVTNAAGYTNEITLNAGSTLELLCGRGRDGAFEGTGIKIQSTISLLATNSYDLSRDFSTNSNPAGVWSFGWKSNFPGAFNVYTNYKRTIDPMSPPGAYLDMWQRFANNQSGVSHNGSDKTALATYGQAVMPPGTVMFVPGTTGNEDNFGVIRFTAPVEGRYLITSGVTNLWHGSMGGDTDFHVLQDGVELFGVWMPADTGSVTNTSGYTNEVVLTAGGTIEFLVGRGADGRYEGSGLKIQANIRLLNTGPVAPWIIQEPLPQIASVGGNAFFSASAGGSDPLSYQWQFNGVNLTNTTWIRGANEPILRIQNVQASHAGKYSLKVSNPAGSATSSSASLIVHNPPAVGITTPIEGTPFWASTDILISAETFDIDDTVRRVEFYAQRVAPDSGPILLGLLTNGTLSSAQIEWQDVPAGSYKLTAVAVDSLGGNATSAPVSIAVLHPEPVVQLKSPEDKDSFSPGANIQLYANAQGDADSRVKRLEFLAGTNLIGAITNGYFSYSLTWSNVPEGLYTITARAIDSNGGVGISSPVNISVGNPSSQPVFRFDRSSYTVNEKDGYVTVYVLKNLSLPASVNYATSDESAIAKAGDYTNTAGRLDFGERLTMSTITIPINDDSQLEGPETFTICLSLPSNGGILAEPSCATITILDNDAYLGSCPSNVPPSPVPATIGSLCVNLEPANAQGQWRFAWETGWRNNGAIVSGLARGNYELEFKPVRAFTAPNPHTIPVDTNGLVSVTKYYDPSGTQYFGVLAITVQPNDVATNSETEFRGQWRLEGEDNWRDSGEGLSNLIAGTYLVQFKPVRGRTTPTARQVQVGADQINTVQATYLIAPEVRPDVILPHPLEFAQITNDASGLPYAFNGQIKSDVGWASGFLVKERVVLTAAHVLFDDASLSYVTGVRWFFQRHADTYEPVPQSPRGWYVRSGYAMERTNTPGNASAFSQKLDFAALYFTQEDAGRGGYGGYLVSEPDGTQWLEQNANKILVGYPVSGTPECTPGIMHATDPSNLEFSQVLDGVYRTSDILSLPGNSGGPLCVQYTNGCYYPAAICLGGSGETIVHVIDPTVADLINQAEISSHGGENHVGGGVITVISSFNGNQFCSGSVSVNVGPRSVVNAGGAWRVSPAFTKYSDYTNFSTRTAPFPVQNGDFAIEFLDVPGFRRPTNSTVQVYCNQGVTIAANYQVIPPTMQWVSDPSTNYIKLTGTRGTSYRIDYADALGSNAVWKPMIMSVTLGNDGTSVTGVNPTNQFRGFYRTVWLP